MNEYATVWALSALALGEMTVIMAFGVVTFIFMFIAWPLMYFLKALYRVFLGYD